MGFVLRQFLAMLVGLSCAFPAWAAESEALTRARDLLARLPVDSPVQMRERLEARVRDLENADPGCTAALQVAPGRVQVKGSLPVTIEIHGEIVSVNERNKDRSIALSLSEPNAAQLSVEAAELVKDYPDAVMARVVRLVAMQDISHHFIPAISHRNFTKSFLHVLEKGLNLVAQDAFRDVPVTQVSLAHPAAELTRLLFSRDWPSQSQDQRFQLASAFLAGISDADIEQHYERLASLYLAWFEFKARRYWRDRSSPYDAAVTAKWEKIKELGKRR